MTKTYFTVEHNYFSAGINESEEAAFEREDAARQWALDRLLRHRGSVFINGCHYTTKELRELIQAGPCGLPDRKEA